MLESSTKISDCLSEGKWKEYRELDNVWWIVLDLQEISWFQNFKKKVEYYDNTK